MKVGDLLSFGFGVNFHLAAAYMYVFFCSYISLLQKLFEYHYSENLGFHILKIIVHVLFAL